MHKYVFITSEVLILQMMQRLNHMCSLFQPGDVTEQPCFNTNSSLSKEVLLDRIRGTIYGNCIGDAIGLLTEFMSKKEAMYVS